MSGGQNDRRANRSRESSHERMAEQERIREKTDKDENWWTKVYFGDDIDELPDIVDQELRKRLKV